MLLAALAAARDAEQTPRSPAAGPWTRTPVGRGQVCRRRVVRCCRACPSAASPYGCRCMQGAAWALRAEPRGPPPRSLRRRCGCGFHAAKACGAAASLPSCCASYSGPAGRVDAIARRTLLLPATTILALHLRSRLPSTHCRSRRCRSCLGRPAVLCASAPRPPCFAAARFARRVLPVRTCAAASAAYCVELPPIAILLHSRATASLAASPHDIGSLSRLVRLISSS
jgi:hypothetical protein